jgi:carboxymethylenebutenolidase
MTMSVEMTDIALGAALARIAAPARPAAPARVGVLLYPTIMGVNAPMERFAAELVALGMTVAIWDPYRGEPVSDELTEMVPRSQACEDGAAIDDLTAIADHMQTALGLRRIAGIGWCFGGRIGLLHAGLDERIAVLGAYNPTMLSPMPVEVAGVGVTSRADLPGQTMDELELARRIVGPVQVTRPGRDFTQPAEYQALIEALFQRPAPTFYEYHPGVDHGFSYTPGEDNRRAHRYAWAGTLSLLSTLGAEV